jgi:hypothetical protein
MYIGAGLSACSLLNTIGIDGKKKNPAQASSGL